MHEALRVFVCAASLSLRAAVQCCVNAAGAVDSLRARKAKRRRFFFFLDDLCLCALRASFASISSSYRLPQFHSLFLSPLSFAP